MTDDDQFLADLHAIADRARASELEGSAAPNSWQQVLATVNTTTETTSERKPSMNTHAAQPMSPVWQQSIPHNEQSRSFGGSIRHFTNLAATIALVLAFAVGGWLAMSQMPSGDSDPRFAVLGTPEVADATCDVEPMTVDELMEIVENPYRYIDVAKYPTPRYGSTDHTPWLDEYAEVQPNVDSTLVLGAGDVPTQTAFDQSSEVISRYINCLQENPSVAMMLRFSDPFSIQNHVRMEFPFYRTEDDVREYVTTWLNMTDGYHSFTGLEKNENHTFGQIDDRYGATTQVHDFGMGFDQVIYVGTEVYDENGEYLGIFLPMLNLTYGRDGEYADRGVIFTLIHSRYTGEWYVVTDGWIFIGGS